jgi:hypothetical protein
MVRLSNDLQKQGAETAWNEPGNHRPASRVDELATSNHPNHLAIRGSNSNLENELTITRKLRAEFQLTEAERLLPSTTEFHQSRALQHGICQPC